MHRIAIVDTYYPEMLSRWQFSPEAGYAAELQRLLEFSFGTGDFYSRNLRPFGWECCDIIGNARPLQEMWAKENGCAMQRSVELEQVARFKPDVVFCQNLSFFSPAELEILGKKYLLAGQCSCPMPSPNHVKPFKVLFTSFPHYVQKFRELGVKPVYLPLAFDPITLDRTEECTRDIDMSFVGGVGSPSHWKAGMDVLEAVASEIPTSQFWGYGAEALPKDSAIRAKHNGPAFGNDMYQILRRSKIVLNRHGEVAQGWANNMRLFEATGCGACVLTEDAPNLGHLFTYGEPVRYSSPQDAVVKIKALLADGSWKERGENGQAATMDSHTYTERMSVLSVELKAML